VLKLGAERSSYRVGHGEVGQYRPPEWRIRRGLVTVSVVPGSTVAVDVAVALSTLSADSAGAVLSPCHRPENVGEEARDIEHVRAGETSF
jgi:hypothetical protein